MSSFQQLTTLSCRPAVVRGRPKVADGRPAHLLQLVRADLLLSGDLRAAAELLQVVQEDAEAAAETEPLPQALKLPAASGWNQLQTEISLNNIPGGRTVMK